MSNPVKTSCSTTNVPNGVRPPTLPTHGAEVKERHAAERQAFLSWWAGDRTRPFSLNRWSEYCVCAVLFPGWRGIWRFYVRGTLGWLAGRLPGSFLKICAFRFLGARIGRNVYFAPDVILDPLYPDLIELGDDCFLGMGCRIIAHEYTAGAFRLGRVKIGCGAVVGGFATVRSGVSVGERTTVGFNSLVAKDVPPGVTVGGVPARPLYFAAEQDEALDAAETTRTGQ